MPDSPAPYLHLGRTLAALRRQTPERLSQIEVAGQIGISQGHLSALERGQHRPEPDTLHALAALYRVPYTDLARLAGYLEAPPTPDELDRAIADAIADQDEALAKLGAARERLFSLLRRRGGGGGATRPQAAGNGSG